MKVLMVTDIFPSEENPTSGVFIYELAKALSGLCQVDLVHPRFWYPLGHRHPKVRRKKVRESIEPPVASQFRPRLFIPPVGDRIFLRGLSFFLSMLPLLMRSPRQPRYDVLHAHMAAPAGFAGVLAGKMLRRPVLVTCHGSDIHTYPKYRFLRSMVSYTLKSASMIVFVSRALLQGAKDQGLFCSKGSVVHNGYDPCMFEPGDKWTNREKLGLSPDHKIVLFVGNLIPVKGLSTLLTAFAHLTKHMENALLILVGTGELETKLRNQSSSLGILSRVRFVGSVPHGEIPTWIRACDVFCLPSLNEGCPTVILEALSCGRPVVASRVGGIPELITNEAQGILVPPNEHVELSSALSNALKCNWNDFTISNSVKDYTWEQIAWKYKDIYEDVEGAF